MRAGELRHQVWIKEPTHTPDGVGGKTTTWGTVTVCWGSFRPKRGREWIESGLENAELTEIFRMRYYDGITPAMRMTFGSRTFEVVSITNIDERNRELELTLKELVIA